MLKKITVFLLFTFSCLNFLTAEIENKYRFHTFSPEGGFYHDGIMQIKQDLDGFVWIMMEKELYRFDGYKYRPYYSFFESTGSEKSFKNIAVDSSGRVFAIVGNGLYLYNKTTDSFYKQMEGKISFLKTDKKNTLWLIKEGEFGRYDEAEKTFKPLLNKGKPMLQVHSLVEDDSGFFILSWGRNIFRYNHETKEISLFYTFKVDFYVKSFCIINNNLWVLSKHNTFYRIDIPTGKMIEEIVFLPENKEIYIRSIKCDKNKNIWIATQLGVYVFETDTRQYEHYVHSKTDPFSLPNNSVWIIEEDLQQNLWIGTYSGGVSYVNLEDKNNFMSTIPSDTGLNHNLVSGFAEDEDYLWIATEGGGLNCFNKKTKTFTYLKHDPGKNSLPSNNVKSIVVDPEQNLWLATYRGGLSRYNPRNNTFTNYQYQSNDINSIRTNNLRKLLIEPNSGIWIAYQLNKLVLSYYSFEDKTFTHYSFDEEDDKHYIFDICHGSGNLLWIITHKKLYSMNTVDGSVKQFQHGDSYLEGQTLYVDNKENVWIGTIGNGLMCYETKKDKFIFYDDILQFNVSSIYSICADADNILWLGTDNGLFSYNPQTKVFSRFDKRDGVQGQVFYPLSAFVNKNEELFFGGTNGFTQINSKNIKENPTKPCAFISEFYIDNVSSQPVVEDTYSIENTVSFPNNINLNYKQLNFGFTFSCDNYLVPEKNRYKYRLKGYDDRWIEVGASNRSVFYSKVPSGKYIFEVIASNNDGVWGDKPTQIFIRRAGPPWLSWWAYTIYGLIILAIVCAYIRYYLNQKELKVQLYLDKLDKEKKEEIHQSQLRFFTNISHDFRTPLSLIMASVDKLREEGLSDYYHRILTGNTQRLLSLVNELMDFRTVESGSIPLQVSSTDINHLIENLAFDFNDYANKRNISFEIIKDEKMPENVYVDRQIVEKIVMNLLNNAFRYTQDGGHVSVKTYAHVSDFQSGYENSYTVESDFVPGDCFAIVVSDTGVGISKESIKSVFERFYKVNTVNFDSHLGTGIGLALVKSLVLLHKGLITIYSERGTGSDFVICFSLSPDVYLSEDMDNQQKFIEQEMNGVYEEEDILKELSKKDYKNKRTVLIVEDNHDLRKIMVNYLSTDYAIIEAEDGEIASEILNDIYVDLIISDIMMPRKDGITLCKEVKSNINTSHIPFLLLTAKAGMESRIEGVDSGADIYFEKPIDFKLLSLSVRNVFQQQQKMREYYSKNYFAESSDFVTNQMEREFLKKFIEVIDKRIDQQEMDVNTIANEMLMSRSKLYNKIKGITGKSIVEFILNYRLRKAARLILETDMSMREVMDQIGMESQSYFTRSFKNEFGETPTAFAAKHKKDVN